MKACLSLLLLFSWSLVIHSQIIRVPTDQPTIQAGIDAASEGDTVLVAPGEYFENLEISKSILLTSNFMNENDTSFVSNTIINGSLNEASVIHASGDITVYPIVQGFTITGGQGTADYVGYALGGGIYTTANIKLQYNDIINNNISNPYCIGGGICAIITKDDMEILIQYNNISNNSLEGFGESTGGGIGIYAFSEVSSGNIRILNNIIANNHIGTVILADVVSGGGGIHLRSRFPVLLSKNIIINNKGIFGGGILLYEDYGSLTKIINNTIMDNEATQQGGGLCIVNGRADIANSIFWNNVAPIDSCISVRGDLDINYSITSREYTGTNNLVEDPLFAEDFLLANNSPAIDAGNPDENFNDVEDPTNIGNPLWPSKGTLTNDIGATGGNYEMELPDSEYSLPKRFLYGDYNGVVFRIAKPLNYDSTNYYPMTVYLHEQYRHGTDNEQHLHGGLKWRSSAEYYEHNEFTLVPQNRVGPRWNVDELNEVIHHIVDLYPIDTTRIYMVGYSEGGAGLCSYIRKYPEIIAAGIPCAESNWGIGMKFVPFWVIHGSDDNVVSVNYARNTIAGFEETGLDAFRTEENSTIALDSVINSGGRLLYSEYQGADHFISPYVFLNENIYKWIAKQRKPQILPNQAWTDKSHYSFPNDIVNVGMNFINKDEYDANYTAHISSFDKSVSMDIDLFDDGVHNDSEADDGIWGNVFGGLNSEQFFRVAAKVHNTDLSTDFYFQDLARFTTVVPMTVDSYEASQMDTLNKLRISNISLKNNSQSTKVEDIILTLSSQDTSVHVLNHKIYNDFAPEQIKFAQGSIYIEVDTIKDYTLFAEIGTEDFIYWIDTIYVFKDSIVSVNSEDILPMTFALEQNYPNPFNPSTTIKYQIPVEGKITNSKLKSVVLRVYDVLGKEVATLVNEEQTPGNYEVVFDGSSLSSGIYFYRLSAGASTGSATSYVETKKMILLK